jgi:hypothetical protein
MAGPLRIVWLILVVVVLLLLLQTVGIIDWPVVRDVRRALPIGGPLTTVTVPTAAPGAVPSVGVSKPSPAVVASPPAASGEGCTPGTPRFVFGAAALKAALGASMGDPTECERGVDAAGNTEQKTTTGLVYYRAGRNVTVFTNGWDHWALLPGGLVHWTGDALEPPT